MAVQSDFKQIWKLIKQIDRITGLFMFKDGALTKREKLQHLIMPLHCILVIILIISTLWISKLSLLSILLCSTILQSTLTVYYIMLNMAQNKGLLRSCFEWCRDLDKLWEQETYRRVLGDKSHLIAVRKLILKINTFMRQIIIAETIIGTIGFVAIGYFLPENIYPKFTLPIPFYLPFTHQETWFAFSVTLTFQFVAALYFILFALFFFEVFFALVIHMIGMLDIVLEIVRKLSYDLQHNAILNYSSLKTISENPDDEPLTLNEWLKLITNLLSEINEKVSSVIHFMSRSFIFLELSAISFLLLAGLILVVIKQQQPFAFVCCSTAVLLFVLCYVNEKLLEKYEMIADEYYNVPWYQLSSNDRKMILIAMNCNKIQEGFTAAGIHRVTLDRFVKIMKIAYSNFIILKDLVK